MKVLHSIQILSSLKKFFLFYWQNNSMLYWKWWIFFTRGIFGLNKTNVSTVMILIPKQKKNLIKFISQELYNLLHLMAPNAPSKREDLAGLMIKSEISSLILSTLIMGLTLQYYHCHLLFLPSMYLSLFNYLNLVNVP